VLYYDFIYDDNSHLDDIHDDNSNDDDSHDDNSHDDDDHDSHHENDYDGDGIKDNDDLDDDNDGILDIDDEFPLDETNNPILVNRLENLAVRGFVGSGNKALIGGLVISGSEMKTVLIRARGPALADDGVFGVLPDPQVLLFSGSTLIDSNDDWQEHEKMGLIPEELQPSNVQESVIVATLAPGSYTAIVTGVNGEEGIGLVEVFELSDTKLTRLQNVAMRGFVGEGDNVLIGGLFISGTKPKALVIRAKGPSLADVGVTDVLANPNMHLFSGSTLIDSNDNWGSHHRVDDIPIDLRPTDNLESVIYTLLEPGAYTVIVSGVDNGTGIGILEIFEVW